MGTEKRCTKCKEIKNLTEFHYLKKSKQIHSWCKNCHISYHKVKSRIRLYGSTPEDIEKILKKQKYKCPICQSNIKEKYHVDHNHQTREIRGLLCKHCNVGLGFFKDRIDLLSKAVVFLYERGSYGTKH